MPFRSNMKTLFHHDLLWSKILEDFLSGWLQKESWKDSKGEQLRICGVRFLEVVLYDGMDNAVV